MAGALGDGSKDQGNTRTNAEQGNMDVVKETHDNMNTDL